MTGKRDRTITFRARLALCIALVSYGGFATASLVLFLAAQRALRMNQDAALLTLARTEVASAVDAPGGGIHVHEVDVNRPGPEGSRGYEKLVQIQDISGKALAQTVNLQNGPELPSSVTRAADPLRVSFTDIVFKGKGYRAAGFPFRDPTGRPLRAIVALPNYDAQRSLNTLLGVLGLCLLIGVGPIAWVSAYLARSLTRPMVQIAVAARSVGGDDLSARIPPIKADVECRDVAGVLNDMLDRLESAFEAREQLVASQRRFIADASHEMRSPLANLRGTVEVALRRPRCADEYKETLGVALTEIERLCRLVDDLLTLSRADAGQFRLDCAPCSLLQIGRQAVTACAARARRANVNLSIEAEEDAPVRGDADRLRQVVDNLLDNAVRHAPPGSTVQVSVSCEGEKARLSVADSGPGLTPEDRERIFDRFYRADRSRARHSGGQGLGLAIARTIVEAHQGTLTVESEPGLGATFSVILPVETKDDNMRRMETPG
jgi:two-component system OmpR family sensor kinase